MTTTTQPPEYDGSTVGKAFVRTREIRISYPRPNTAEVVCTEENAVFLVDGTTRSLGDRGSFVFGIAPEQMTTTVQLVHPSTGADIAGQTVTIQQVMLGILAVIRAQQRLRDARA